MNHQPKHFHLLTDHYIAIDSNDHLYPRGTATDNTHHPPFVLRCEELFPKGLTALDLGCAGGGLVYDFIERGHRAVGLEGSDYSQVRQRACWSLIPDHLKTCDITKPFTVCDITKRFTPLAEIKPVQFKIICAWETLEHISQNDVKQVTKNIHNHLADDGLFVASIAQFEDEDNAKRIVYHQTLATEAWWLEQFRLVGLVPANNPFSRKDYVRGAGNFSGDADFYEPDTNFKGFHLTLKKAPAV